MKKKKSTKKCTDKNCAIHGSLSCRGKVLTGIVTSTKMYKTAVVEFERRFYLPKFERYEKRRTKVKAHNPACLQIKEGDIVRIHECRPLSKTKHFVIVENIGKKKGFKERMEALEESKIKKEEVKKDEVD